MSFKSIIRTLKRAAPVILANAPAVIAAFREVKKAAKRPAGAPPKP
jgi:hypothetical protein